MTDVKHVPSECRKTFSIVSIARRAPDKISSPSGGSVRSAFKREVAKVKPSHTRRPRRAAQLLSVPEVALFMQELASDATSNLGLDGMDHGQRRLHIGHRKLRPFPS